MRLGWEEIDCIFVDMDDLDLPVMIPDLDIYRYVRLYEALAVKVVLVSVACRSLSLVTPLCPGRVLRVS